MDWERYEEELKELKKIFFEIAKENQFRIIYDEKDWPSVSLEWNFDNWERKLQMFLESNKSTYALSGYKSKGDTQAGYRAEILKIYEGVKHPFSDITKKQLIKFIGDVNRL